MSAWKQPDEVVLLAGDNPQVPKGDGDEPVRYYIDAAPGWKGEVAATLDRLIVAAVPDVDKAVRWNSPFYGLPGEGWFISYHALSKYMKVTFFAGSSLDPEPPHSSKDPTARFVHIFEDGALDEEQFTDWVRQASQLPGWDGT